MAMLGYLYEATLDSLSNIASRLQQASLPTLTIFWITFAKNIYLQLLDAVFSSSCCFKFFPPSWRIHRFLRSNTVHYNLRTILRGVLVILVAGIFQRISIWQAISILQFVDELCLCHVHCPSVDRRLYGDLSVARDSNLVRSVSYFGLGRRYSAQSYSRCKNSPLI